MSSERICVRRQTSVPGLVQAQICARRAGCELRRREIHRSCCSSLFRYRTESKYTYGRLRSHSSSLPARIPAPESISVLSSPHRRSCNPSPIDGSPDCPLLLRVVDLPFGASGPWTRCTLLSCLYINGCCTSDCIIRLPNRVSTDALRQLVVPVLIKSVCASIHGTMTPHRSSS